MNCRRFINVLKGDMSIVGPRPTLPYQVELYNDFQRRRLLVKPGITGWAQVNGRNAISWEQRIKLDVWYVENWSLWLDVDNSFKNHKSGYTQRGPVRRQAASMMIFYHQKMIPPLP